MSGARFCPFDGTALKWGSLSVLALLYFQRGIAATVVVAAAAGAGYKLWPEGGEGSGGEVRSVVPQRVEDDHVGTGEEPERPPVIVYTLSVESDPQGAEVWINESLAGNTPLVDLRLDGLQQGDSLNVVLKKDCFHDQRAPKTMLASDAEIDLGRVSLRERQYEIELRSNPAGAEVLGAGGTLGRTPYRARIPCEGGSFVVRKDDYFPKEVSLQRSTASPHTVSLQARPVDLPEYRLTATSRPPGATILINGVFSGRKTPVTDWTLRDAKEGDSITLALECYVDSAPLKLGAHRSPKLERDLKQEAPRRVKLTSDPSGAKILKGTTQIGVTPQEVDVPCKGATFQLSKDCYEAGEITLGRTDTGRDVVKLRKQRPTKIRLVSDPSGADVYDGEKKLGPTPREIDAPCGVERTIRLEKAKYEPREVTLRSTDKSPRIVKLEPEKPEPKGPKEPEPEPEPEKPDYGPMVQSQRAGVWIDVYEYPNERGTKPRVAVTLDEAERLCRERGKRLCRIEELIAACEGPLKNNFPWGKKYRANQCNMDDSKWRLEPSGQRATCKTDPDGIFDIKGNIGEWASGGDPPDKGEAAVYGKPTNHPRSFSACEKYTYWNADRGSEDIGFRCCRK